MCFGLLLTQAIAEAVVWQVEYRKTHRPHQDKYRLPCIALHEVLDANATIGCDPETFVPNLYYIGLELTAETIIVDMNLTSFSGVNSSHVSELQQKLVDAEYFIDYYQHGDGKVNKIIQKRYLKDMAWGVIISVHLLMLTVILYFVK